MTANGSFQALLLAAGYGTRLGDAGQETPKALLPLGGRPLLDHLVDDLARVRGLDGITTVTNRRFVGPLEGWARRIRDRLPVPVRILDDGTEAPEERLGAVGDLAFALERMERTGDLLVLATDTLPGFPLAAFVEAFRGRPTADVLLAVRREPDAARLRHGNVVALDEGARVTEFVEKPTAPASHLTALPLYLLRKPVLGRVPEYIATGGERDAPGHLVAWLVHRLRVEAWRTPAGKPMDVGTPEGYREARRRAGEG